MGRVQAPRKRVKTQLHRLQHRANGHLKKKNEFTSLRLIISSKNYYVYVDFPKGDALRETGIPIQVDPSGTRCIEDNNIRAFLKKAFGELPVYSYWIT